MRCSLEDVADNMVSSQLARGEKESMVIRALCETLTKTGSSAEIVATTMMSALKRALSADKSDCDIMKDIGRTMHEQGAQSKYHLHLHYVTATVLMYLCIYNGLHSKIATHYWDPKSQTKG